MSLPEVDQATLDAELESVHSLCQDLARGMTCLSAIDSEDQTDNAVLSCVLQARRQSLKNKWEDLNATLDRALLFLEATE